MLADRADLATAHSLVKVQRINAHEVHAIPVTMMVFTAESLPVVPGLKLIRKAKPNLEV